MNKLVPRIFGIYCCLLIFGAAVNLAADPSDQPTKDISAIVFLGSCLFGLIKKNKKAMLGFPAFAMIMFGITFANAKNMTSAIGGMVGVIVAMSMWYLSFKQIQQPEQIKEKEVA